MNFRIIRVQRILRLFRNESGVLKFAGITIAKDTEVQVADISTVVQVHFNGEQTAVLRVKCDESALRNMTLYVLVREFLADPIRYLLNGEKVGKEEIAQCPDADLRDATVLLEGGKPFFKTKRVGRIHNALHKLQQ